MEVPIHEINSFHMITEIIMTLMGGIVAFFLKKTINKVDELQKEVGEHALDDARRYATQDALERAMNKVDNSMAALSNKVDSIPAQIITLLNGRTSH